MHANRFPLVAIVASAASLCVALLTAAALACVAPASAGAVPALEWRTHSIDPGALSGVSCASTSLCAAVDRSGHVLISAAPAAVGPWSSHAIDPGHALTAVSCAPGGALCVAVDDDGHTLASDDAGTSWSAPLDIDGTASLTGVSCASASLCVAVDRSGNVFVSIHPSASAWSSGQAIDGHPLTSVSCTSAPLCVAVDEAGGALSSTDPAGGSWSAARTIDSNLLAPTPVSASCAPGPANSCVAVSAGEVFASGNAGASASATWNATPLGGGALTGVACEAAGLCVAVDGGGDAYVGDNPTAAAPSWAPPSDIDSPNALSGVSCVAEGLCAAVDGAGDVSVATVPLPAVEAKVPNPVDVAETVAEVNGTVNTNDAILSSCRFEYGTSEAYGQSVPCPALAAGSATQTIGARLEGLVPNVTYDYRLVAVGSGGEARSANVTFKTPAPPLVQPHPSIGGLPALGQRLTCKSGVSGTGAAAATLGYAWLRNTRAIGGATSSTYAVAGADVSQHLQCRVTATNAGGSATATSAFVTVPAGGLGAISETQVGSPRVAGRTVSVPVTCSAQAAGSCTITLRLTAVETLRRGRVVAVAARAQAAARRNSTHRTVTVGAVTAHLPAGHRGTVTVALNATGRALLKRVHKLAAKLSVSGTVVGAIGAQLRTATVTFGASAGRASSRRRR
ncbi:MAG TPA: hypothetical protein VNV42_12915 [Solirubrobacteraceae bacterium]|jgi:hypothetical protein|nr:hypothetical protein [Solirubrobacteraceae bacterium]